MRTHFAPAKRADPDTLDQQIAQIGSHPFCSAVLQSCGGVVMALNSERQIIGLNTVVLQALGFDQPDRLLGLRPGEALGCTHAKDAPGGCGTGEFCRTCGAVLAIMACQQSDQEEERECLMDMQGQDGPITRAFNARSVPLRVDGDTYTLLILVDIQAQKNLDALQRVFFHDLNNTISSLLGVSQLMQHPDPAQRAGLARVIEQLVGQLADQVESQYHLWSQVSSHYQPRHQAVSPGRILADVKAAFKRQAESENKELVTPELIDDLPFVTDPSLLTTVLINMVKNALEATAVAGRVRLWSERRGDRLSFYTWNQGQMNESTALRVFQRYFTTKTGAGRGMGAYSMKLLGEKYLGGQVGFTTSEGGTVFFIHLPPGGPPAPPPDAALANPVEPSN